MAHNCKLQLHTYHRMKSEGKSMPTRTNIRTLQTCVNKLYGKYIQHKHIKTDDKRIKK